MIATGLRTLLLAQSAVTDLVGSTGVYVNDAGQSESLPYVVITTIDTDPMLALDGTYGMRSAELDVDCWGQGYVSAKAVADAVRAYLDDFTGAITGGTVNAVLWLDERDGPIGPEDGKGTGRHLVTVEFEIQFTPS